MTVPSMKISIITVCRNAENTIDRTLRSVAEQTWPHIEYIIVDGKSQDRTLEIVDRYRSKLALVISEPDRGIYDAMNKGVKAATGDYLLFLNADDHLICETAIENICGALNENPKADIVYGNVLIYDRTTGKGGIWNPGRTSLAHLYRSTIPHPATFFKREVFSTVGLYNTDHQISSDYELILKAFKAGCRFKHADLLVSVFNQGGLSTALESGETVRRERDAVKKRHLTPMERFFLRIRVRIKKIFNV